MSCGLGVRVYIAINIAILQYKSRKNVDLNTAICKLNVMANKERTHYNTTLNVDLLKRLKFLSIELNKRHNDLIEEAIELLLKKYEKRAKE